MAFSMDISVDGVVVGSWSVEGIAVDFWPEISVKEVVGFWQESSEGLVAVVGGAVEGVAAVDDGRISAGVSNTAFSPFLEEDREEHWMSDEDICGCGLVTTSCPVKCLAPGCPSLSFSSSRGVAPCGSSEDFLSSFPSSPCWHWDSNCFLLESSKKSDSIPVESESNIPLMCTLFDGDDRGELGGDEKVVVDERVVVVEFSFLFLFSARLLLPSTTE